MLSNITDEVALCRNNLKDPAERLQALARLAFCLALVVACWAYFALHPAEEKFLLRDFLRLDLVELYKEPSPRLLKEYQFQLISYSTGWLIYLVWVYFFIVTSIGRKSVFIGYGVAWKFTIIGSIALGVAFCGALFIAEAFKLFGGLVDDTGGVGNAVIFLVSIVVMIGFAGVILLGKR